MAKRPKKPATNGKTKAPAVGHLNVVAIDTIVPSPFQRRRVFDKGQIAELAESIASAGLAHPPVVRPSPVPKLTAVTFELVVGERRLRACKHAGLAEIPVDVRDLDDAGCRALVAAENLGRQDLNAIEEAETFQMMIDAGDAAGPTELAAKLGVSQAHVSNRLRLLELPEKVQAKIISREIPPTHARSLVSLKDHPKLINGLLKAAKDEERIEGRPLTVQEFADLVFNVVLGETRNNTRRWCSKLSKELPKLKLTEQQRGSLGILTIQDPRTGGPPMERFTNVKRWDQLCDAQEAAAVERAAKQETAGRGAKEIAAKNGAPKRKLTATAQKQIEQEAREKVNAAAAQFRKRLWRWYVNWVRWLIARELRTNPSHEELLLVLLFRGGEWPRRVYRDGWMFQFNAAACLVQSAREAKAPIGACATVAKDLATMPADHLWKLAGEFASRMFHSKDGPCLLAPAEDVGAIASRLEIQLDKTWEVEQAGPEYSEAFWRLHSVDQLKKLGAELGVALPKVHGKKGDFVEAFLEKIPAADAVKPKGIALPKEIVKIKRPKR